MCTMISEHVEVAGSGKGAAAGFQCAGPAWPTTIRSMFLSSTL